MSMTTPLRREVMPKVASTACPSGMAFTKSSPTSTIILEQQERLVELLVAAIPRR